MEITVNKLRLFIGLVIVSLINGLVMAKPQHAITLYDEPPKYPANFSHFDYTNANAPKGGTLRLSAFGTFNTLNGFIDKGTPADNLSLLYDTLTVASLDEPNTNYGLVAETIEKAPDSSWVRFYLRKQAKFNDGHPITAEDVVFSFNTLMQQGDPFYRQYYADVKAVTAEAKHQVLFTFKVKNNKELPMIVGQLPVLPKHWWQGKEFTATNLTPPVGSGPYRITQLKAGSTIRFERVKDWWAKDLAVVKGFYNFDVITVDYFRDMSVALEAFKAGQFDYNLEYSAKDWATGYECPALKEGAIIKKELENHNTATLQGFTFNIRKPIFQDIKVREAISLLFDFEWSNRQLFYNSYKRLSSYFENSDMAAHELPTDKELAILEPLKDKIPAQVFTTVFTAPKSDGSGIIREQQRKAYQLLQEAGYEIKNGKMVNKEGKQLKFEFLLAQTNLERVVLPFKANLAEIGISMEIRRVDVAQYINRIRNRDYDMITFAWRQSNSPGNEQMTLWSSASADQQGSMNVIGVKDTAVDTLVSQLIKADSRESLVLHARALDRVLQWGYYMVWGYYTDKWRIAYWNKFGQPTQSPDYDVGLYTWWSLEAANNPTRKASMELNKPSQAKHDAPSDKTGQE